ncbi:hypothetical protein HDV00_002468 [Rhizophlyctis rosea]|nr:hypothetical protein HDV00_002468 [Rhizophlyctis rosea]
MAVRESHGKTGMRDMDDAWDARSASSVTSGSSVDDYGRNQKDYSRRRYKESSTSSRPPSSMSHLTDIRHRPPSSAGFHHTQAYQIPFRKYGEHRAAPLDTRRQYIPERSPSVASFASTQISTISSQARLQEEMDKTSAQKRQELEDFHKEFDRRKAMRQQSMDDMKDRAIARRKAATREIEEEFGDVDGVLARLLEKMRRDDEWADKHLQEFSMSRSGSRGSLGRWDTSSSLSGASDVGVSRSSRRPSTASTVESGRFEGHRRTSLGSNPDIYSHVGSPASVTPYLGRRYMTKTPDTIGRDAWLDERSMESKRRWDGRGSVYSVSSDATVATEERGEVL